MGTVGCRGWVVSGPSVQAINVDPQPALSAWRGRFGERLDGWIADPLTEPRSQRPVCVSPSESRNSALGAGADRDRLSRVARNRKSVRTLGRRAAKERSLSPATGVGVGGRGSALPSVLANG